VVLVALAATSACSGDTGTTAPTTAPTSATSTAGAAPSAAACAFPPGAISRIAARWRAVALAQDARAEQRAAVRYRDAIGRVRAAFAIACPDLEETFNQVFVDAQFLVERTGGADDVELTELVRNAEALVAALGLQDEVRFVAPTRG
jgi:hypothetical protein